MFRFCQIAVLVFGLVFCSAKAVAVEKISLYSHYTTAPFAVEGVAPEVSYTVRLAGWLSAQSHGRYLFEARQIPRLRLNLIVAQPNWQGVVAWANPVWFDDPLRQRFLWSDALLSDRNVLVSRRADGWRFTTRCSAQPVRLGAIRGHFYADLEPLIQRGLLLREDAQNDLSNMLKLQHRRVDMAVVQASALPYLRSELADFDQWANVDQAQHPSYQRFLLTSTANTQLMAFLQQEVARMAQAPEWAELHNTLLP